MAYVLWCSLQRGEDFVQQNDGLPPPGGERGYGLCFAKRDHAACKPDCMTCRGEHMYMYRRCGPLEDVWQSRVPEPLLHGFECVGQYHGYIVERPSALAQPKGRAPTCCICSPLMAACPAATVSCRLCGARQHGVRGPTRPAQCACSAIFEIIDDKVRQRFLEECPVCRVCHC